MISELAGTLAFYAFALVTILAALGVVLGKNLVHSALLLTVSFLGVAGLYFQLAADFLAAAQIMIYAGAVAVLIIMGVMVTRRKDMAHSNPERKNRLGAFFLTGALFVLMVAVFIASPLPADMTVVADTVSALADLMLLKYVLPFEIAAILLLVAMLGAIILAKGADEE